MKLIRLDGTEMEIEYGVPFVLDGWEHTIYEDFSGSARPIEGQDKTIEDD